LDLKEYPPVVINQIGEKNKDLKAIDSVSMHYNLTNFKTIEGIYYLIYVIIKFVFKFITLINYHFR
jgi:hypothetical protein